MVLQSLEVLLLLILGQKFIAQANVRGVNFGCGQKGILLLVLLGLLLILYLL